MVGIELKSMSLRATCSILVCAALASNLVACNAFDRGQLDERPGGAGGTGGTGGTIDGGDDDSGVCVPTTETCNGIDEDCDGVADEDDPDALAMCESIVVHAKVRCASTLTTGGLITLCARVSCDPGWSTCDGSPSNGCEYEGDTCPSCLTCEDAGQDDGGY